MASATEDESSLSEQEAADLQTALHLDHQITLQRELLDQKSKRLHQDALAMLTSPRPKLMFGLNCSYDRRLDVLTGAERMPPPGIQAQRPLARIARMTRQINGAIVVGM